jgi:porphobilinogen synthase
MPLFVRPGSGVKKEISSMPGNYQMSIDELVKECIEIEKLGIPGVLLFGIPEKKDETGEYACSDDGIVQSAVKAIKEKVKKLLVITDVCNCEYTTHGHCGPLKDGDVDNDATCELLAKQALSHVKAGADMVAPSDMMDGRIGIIRSILDENGFEKIPIMSYAAKYASAFYGPFRDAAESAPSFGDRKTYQMDPANSDEALREVFFDIDEGADMVMVKPALSYLDIIYRVKQETGMPLAAYNVSGEFSIVMAGAEKKWIDKEKVMMEVLLSMKRAGADILITYFAKEAAKLLKDKR